MPPQQTPFETLLSAGFDPLALLRSVADHLPHSIWFQFNDGRIAYTNRRFLKFFGGTEDEPGKFIDFVHVEDAEAWSDFCRLRTPEAGDVMLRLRSADGQFHRLSVTVSPVSNRASELIGLTCMIRWSEEFARGLLNSLPEQIAVLDEQGVVCAVNEAWEKFTAENAGNTQVLTIGVNYLDVCRRSSQAGDECATNVLNQLEALLAGTQEKCAVEYPCHAPNRQRWFLMHAQRFNYGHRGVILSHMDITERKRAESLLREQDNRKDEFLATLAHELRNPLAPIRTGLELMKRAMDDPALLAEVRETMERQTMQLVTLVNDLLDVSRITQGKFQLRKSRVLLNDIVQSAVEACQPLIFDAGQQLTVHIPESPLFLHVDPHRMAQVLSNLLNNATKYTPAGGHISLRAEVIGDELSMTIRDDGIGIPVDMQQRVFEMFAQIPHADEPGTAGLGIGLSLVKSLVGMHGGTVSVASAGPQPGSRFTIRLPISEHLAAVAVQPAPLGTLEKQQKSRLSVLIVDDNEAAAKTLGIAVRMAGHEVRIAHDGREACAATEHFCPHVILSDIGMPHMDGYKLAKWIRQQSWGTNTMLIALTGWGQADDQKRTKEAGFDYHLVKPAEPAEIERLLEAAANPNLRKMPDA